VRLLWSELIKRWACSPVGSGWGGRGGVPAV